MTCRIFWTRPGRDLGNLRFIMEVSGALWPWRLPLYRGVLAGEIALTAPNPEDALPDTDELDRPLVVYLSEHNRVATGPSGWPHAAELIDWSRPGGCLIHAEAPAAKHYDYAVQQAVEHGRFLIVETDAAHARDWNGFIVEQTR